MLHRAPRAAQDRPKQAAHCPQSDYGGRYRYEAGCPLDRGGLGLLLVLQCVTPLKRVSAPLSGPASVSAPCRTHHAGVQVSASLTPHVNPTEASHADDGQ